MYINASSQLVFWMRMRRSSERLSTQKLLKKDSMNSSSSILLRIVVSFLRTSEEPILYSIIFGIGGTLSM